jgi:hypothetical protein
MDFLPRLIVVEPEITMMSRLQNKHHVGYDSDDASTHVPVLGATCAERAISPESANNKTAIRDS